MNHSIKCIDGQIMQNETETDFEIVSCPECLKMEQQRDETDYDYNERISTPSDDDLLREKMKELFPDTEYDRAERGRYYSQKDN
jgi:hypothetical protein